MRLLKQAATAARWAIVKTSYLYDVGHVDLFFVWDTELGQPNYSERFLWLIGIEPSNIRQPLILARLDALTAILEQARQHVDCP
jgi:hypothetical protein